MKRTLIAAASLLAMTAWAAPIGIASGADTGTNYPMVDDIAAACSSPSSPITNVGGPPATTVTNGAMDNINLVFNDKKVQYGVADEVTLEYMRRTDPKMMENIVMVFPFFSTDVHVVVAAASPFKTLADLRGQPVVEGPIGSSTQVTTQIIKGLTGYQFAATPLINASQAAGLKAVQAGQVAAMFVTAGAPISVLRSAPGIRILSIQDPALDNFKYFTKTSIPASTYPQAGNQSIQTYKLRNGLITYNYRNQYQAEIGALVTCIAKKLPVLQKGEGGGGKDGVAHPKWRDVDVLDINQMKWPVHPSALRAIKAATSTK